MSFEARSVADLTGPAASSVKVKFLFFWGHQPERDGSAGAGCLSQWAPTPFTVDGVTFATAEHWMMWSKARLFGDEATAERVLAAPHPKAAKDLGGRAAGFDQQTWNDHRFGIVVDGYVA